MKKIILVASFAAILISCGDKKKETTEETNTAVDTSFSDKPAVAEVSEFQRGSDLIAASDCLACHKIDEKLVGPTYKEVAAKYTEADIAMLSKKIIEGGQGVWGEVPMTAHPAVSTEDATEMVKYILSLK